MTQSRQEFGRAAEKLAARHLTDRGYELVEENLRTRWGEIDLVARKNEAFVFVEVKAGRELPDFSPSDHFDLKKQERLLRLAKAYLSKLPAETEARFDLITVTDRGGSFIVEHYEDVLEDHF